MASVRHFVFFLSDLGIVAKTISCRSFPMQLVTQQEPTNELVDEPFIPVDMVVVFVHLSDADAGKV